MSEDISLFLVFAAGFLSFLSPCVLPLIPSYFSILGGVGLGVRGARARGTEQFEGRFQRDRASKGEIPEGQSTSRGIEQPAEADSNDSRGTEHYFQPRLVRAAAGFILGFSTVFIGLGILVSATFFLMGGISRHINWIAGIIVIVLGFNVIFDFISFLNYEKRPFLRKLARPGLRVNGLFTAFIAGAAFGAGWTPCIGPVLASILLMAGQSGQTAAAVLHLALFSAGLGLPFFLAAIFFNSFLKHSVRLRSHFPMIQRISGIILIIIGFMILTDLYSALNILIQSMIFSYIDWAETRALPFRFLANWLGWLQRF